MATADDLTTDEVLSDPSEHTVEEVLAAFAVSDEATVRTVQELEAEGRDRKGIAEYSSAQVDADAEVEVDGDVRPAVETIAADEADEDEFSRERILGAEGPGITGFSVAEIAGALHGDDAETFTRSQVAFKVEEFYGRTLHTEEG